MRFAKTGDVWRNLYKRNFRNKITNLEFADIKGLGNGRISFSGGITVICGANGVGKTTLLNALFLSSKTITDPIPHNIKNRFKSSNLVVNVFENGNVKTYTKYDVKDELGFDAEVEYIDSSNKSSRLIDFFSNTTNINEILEGIDPIQYKQEEIDLISYVTGKNYSSYSVYEIGDYDPDQIQGFDDVIPYFKVIDNNVEYGVEMMGLGELAAHLLIWSIKRAANDSLFFLEEPESFISPRAQINLMNYIASVSLEKGIWLVMTTHSMGIVSNIPLNHIKIISKNNHGIQIIENPSQYQLNMILGISFSYTGILFVEDLASKIFARSILDHFDGDISRRFDIVKADSASGISSILYTFPRTSKDWLRIIGLYDGDMWTKRKTIINENKVKWNYTFLPGTEAPEILLRNFFRNNTHALATTLGIKESEINFALSSLEGCNHHDWPTEIAKYLEVDEETLLRNMFKIWLDNANNSAIANICFTEITKHFSA